ncbi:UNVERIFIED_CONTAM: hypothetical protein GTU68_050844 [Idotea baltica]|nr:hypothetical protein [Idotea baltica]
MHRSTSDQITRTIVFICITISGLLFLAFNNAHAADADIARGEKLSQTCLGCHGAPGLRNPGPVYLIPKVGGQHPEYIILALQAYKAKTRSHGTMQAQAANLSDQDMIDIAAFFNSLEDSKPHNNTNQTLANKGKELSAVCAACHGATGDGEITAYPKLAGQYESYIAQSLKDYRSGERENIIMSGFSADLTIDQIEALSAWFAGQSGSLAAPQSVLFK